MKGVFAFNKKTGKTATKKRKLTDLKEIIEKLQRDRKSNENKADEIIARRKKIEQAFLDKQLKIAAKYLAMD
jgi:predicted  nucleic acid-binding Zn-ribbon protein